MSELLPVFLSRKQAAQLTGVHLMTLIKWENEGFFPIPVKVGKGSVRYRTSEVEAWIDACKPKGE